MLLCVMYCNIAIAATDDDWANQLIDDTPIIEELEYPEWFKTSFLDLTEDIQDAKQQDKLGVIVYFGQQHCPYCEYLLKINWGEKQDIVEYTKRYFDVVAINIWGQLPVVKPDGTKTTEREYSETADTRFTPSLLFYNTKGKEVFRLRGYYPPYKFRAALDYVIGGYYTRQNFSEYLEHVEPPERFDLEGLNPNPLFTKPPYLLKRTHLASQQPLVVLFEQGLCHACDVLHGHHLQQTKITAKLAQMDVVQLDIWSDVPLQTPDGKRLTARQWAKKLNIFYTPSLVFFDETGQEIIRLDSITGLNRLHSVLQYVLSADYAFYSNYQQWRAEQILQQPCVE
jgi:thioredoxin-related protein